MGIGFRVNARMQAAGGEFAEGFREEMRTFAMAPMGGIFGNYGNRFQSKCSAAQPQVVIWPNHFGKECALFAMRQGESHFGVLWEWVSDRMDTVRALRPRWSEARRG